MSDPELEATARRIERLVEAPEEVRDLLGSVARPVLRVLNWQPKIETKALATLLEALDGSRESLDDHLDDARDELRDNVASVERAAVVHGRIPMAYATWLWKLYQLVRRASSWQKSPPEQRRRRPPRSAGKLDLLPPLAARTNERAVHVLAIDPLIDAARSETEMLGRRRRLLEAAREALLDATAALDLDPGGVRARQSALAREIALVDRLQAAGVRPEIGLTHQLRQALTRGEVQRAHAALVAMNEMAEARGDGALRVLASRGLDTLWQGHDRFAAEHRITSLARSSVEMLGSATANAVEKGFELARRELARLRRSPTSEQGRHLDAIGAPELLRAALAVDGCFDVGGVLTPVRIGVEERALRTVRYPTAELALMPARSVEDVRDAVIGDPRSILLDLAAGRLLARRFIAEEIRRHERTVLRGEARVYLLDGSSSMLGPRAAMRDAILIAELATLRARLDDARRTLQPVLFYRYFTKQLRPTTIVRTREEAEKAIAEVLATVRTGGTNIERALLASFELVREARAGDPELARAQIVLVSDGRAAVDEAKIAAAREAVGKLPIGVSIIALGEENPALRALAARQRARGERIFYHFVPDDELAAIIEGHQSELPLHLPQGITADVLGGELRQVVDEIEQHRRGVDAEALERARLTESAFEEVRLSHEDRQREGLRARAEVLERDWQALGRRFDRWFPLPEPGGAVPTDPGADREDLELLLTLLVSLIEVVELSSADPMQRRGDAIELFERLLMDAGLSPWRTRELLRRHPAALARPIGALRALCDVD